MALAGILARLRVEVTVRRVVLLSLLIAPLIAGGRAIALDQSSQDADTKRVRDVAEGIIAADNARDLARVMAYYADDAVLLPPNEAPVRGKAAITPRYEDLFGKFTPKIVAEIEEVRVAGDWAYVIGFNRGVLVSRNDGDARRLSDAYVMILRRGPKDSWQIARLLWHAVQPPSPR